MVVAKLETIVSADGVTPTGEKALMFMCPGCKALHAPRVAKSAEREHPVWSWNESLEKPTLSPSIKVTWGGPGWNTPKEHVCHSFLVDGQMQFLPDSTHELAGKTVPLPEWKDGQM